MDLAWALLHNRAQHRSHVRHDCLHKHAELVWWEERRQGQGNRNVLRLIKGTVSQLYESTKNQWFSHCIWVNHVVGEIYLRMSVRKKAEQSKHMAPRLMREPPQPHSMAFLEALPRSASPEPACIPRASSSRRKRGARAEGAGGLGRTGRCRGRSRGLALPCPPPSSHLQTKERDGMLPLKSVWGSTADARRAKRGFWPAATTAV